MVPVGRAWNFTSEGIIPRIGLLSGGTADFAALQVLDSPDGMWMNYADEDDVDYSVTHSFDNAVEIHSVTASDAT